MSDLNQPKRPSVSMPKPETILAVAGLVLVITGVVSDIVLVLAGLLTVLRALGLF